MLVMTVPRTEYCIFTERLVSFIFPLNLLNTKGSHAFWIHYQTSLFVCLWGKRIMTHRGKYERKNRGRQSDNSLSRVVDSAGLNIWAVEWERNSPSRFKQLQMCAQPTATAHIWARKLPCTPPFSSSEPSCPVFSTALCSTLEKQLGKLGELLRTRQPIYSVSVYHGRPEETIFPAAGKRDLVQGKFGGFQWNMYTASK